MVLICGKYVSLMSWYSGQAVRKCSSVSRYAYDALSRRKTVLRLYHQFLLSLINLNNNSIYGAVKYDIIV